MYSMVNHLQNDETHIDLLFERFLASALFFRAGGFNPLDLFACVVDSDFRRDVPPKRDPAASDLVVFDS